MGKHEDNFSSVDRNWLICFNVSLVEAYSLFQMNFRLRKLADGNVSRLSQQKRHRELLFAVSMAWSLPLSRVVLSWNLVKIARYTEIPRAFNRLQKKDSCVIYT